MADQQSKFKIDDLNQLYNEADQADQELFAEQRSNVLLVSGDHYTKKGSKFWNRIRDNRELTDQAKLRLTKNHVGKIAKSYVNNIVSQAPSVVCQPKNETELQDQKSAQLNESVWQDARTRHKIRAKTRQWCEDYVTLGECAVKIFWDPNAGELKGYEAEMDEETGQPKIDPDTGEMVASERPVFSGDFVFERIFGFNLLRAPEAKSFAESRFLIVRKMVDKKELLAKVGDDDDLKKLIEEDRDNTYMVYDGSDGGYRMSKGQTMLREFYFRPCFKYPKGWYVIATQKGTLFEGELPFGVFPIHMATFDEIPTTPRGRSIIKQLRPYQAEVNRSASKMAEHQITLGDDKLLVQNGSKLTQSASLPGVRALSYTGMQPGILPGRSGEQYLGYMQAQISEMYQVAMMAEDAEEKNIGQLDPYAMLFRSMREKKKFSLYAEKFEQFLVEVCETYLKLARQYLPDDCLIPAIGKREYVNVSEFKTQTELGYKIKVEPQTDDIESKIGKQLVMNHILQYVGPQMGKDDIGKVIRAMPYGNSEEAFGDFTLDYDNATNDILALDRGEQVQAGKNDDHKYAMKRLTNRMKQADFKFLPQPVQQNYEALLQQHEQIEVQQQQDLKAAEADFIPTGGYLVTCDFYVPDPKDPSTTRRARLPYEAVQWLIQRLEQQGSSLQNLEGMQQGNLADMARMLLQQGGQPQGGTSAGQRPPGGAPPMGQHSMGGAMPSGMPPMGQPRPGMPPNGMGAPVPMMGQVNPAGASR